MSFARFTSLAWCNKYPTHTSKKMSERMVPISGEQKKRVVSSPHFIRPPSPHHPSLGILTCFACLSVLFFWFWYWRVPLWTRTPVCSTSCSFCGSSIYFVCIYGRMKPTRIRMCHSLVMNYGLYEKMEIFVGQMAVKVQLTSLTRSLSPHIYVTCF